MNKPKQWHPSVTLEDFVKQVSDFEHIVELATSHRLRLFDRDDTNFRNAFGWATHIEQVKQIDDVQAYSAVVHQSKSCRNTPDVTSKQNVEYRWT